jgi:hypothetical protein
VEALGRNPAAMPVRSLRQEDIFNKRAELMPAVAVGTVTERGKPE